MYNQTIVNKNDFSTVVKFKRLSSGHIVIPVMIRGKEYSFLLDTGTPNIISKELAEELELNHVYHKKYLDSQNNKLVLSHAEVEEITIGGVSFQNTITAIHNFDKSPPTMRCLNIAGVIGANLMKKSIWQFDFDKDEIVISDHRVSTADANSRTIKFDTGYSGTPKVEVGINGISDGKAIIDFGAKGFYKTSKRTLGKLCKKSIRHKCKSTSGYGSLASGAFGYEKPDSSYVALVHDFSVGPQNSVQLQNQLITLSNHSDKLMGLDFFKGFLTTIDWLKNELILTNKQHIESVDTYESYGFRVVYIEEKLFIGFIYNNSPASISGLRLGDQVIQVNEYNFKGTGENEFCEFLNSNQFEKTEELHLTILRKNKPVMLTLTKEDLFAYP